MGISPTPLPARLASRAARQHGVLSLDELVEVGLPKSTIADWARAGHLHRLHPGVYSLLPPGLLGEEGRWLAAVRACGGSAFLSHVSAGQLLFLVDRSLHRAIHVTVPDRRRLRTPGLLVHRPRVVDRVDRTSSRQIPTSTPTRVVWDLAASESPRITRRAFERAQSADRIDRARLHELLDACPHHRGAGLLRTLLAERGPALAEVRSWLEQLALHVCSERRLPLPAVNDTVLGWEVDLLWEAPRFVVEADGGDHLAPRQRDLDNQRDAELARAGYLVRRYSSLAMAREAAVAAEIGEILAERRQPPDRWGA